MARVTFTDKVATRTSDLPAINQVKDIDLNELKISINTLYDDVDAVILEVDGKEPLIGFTPENISNKQTNLTASATKYPTVNAVNTGLATKENSLPTMVGQSLKVLRVNADETAKEWVTISTGGIFGIANGAGVYTYYATFALAMTAATSGQTIELFSDVTETTAVSITLKTGVNINGNGHTYTLNVAGVTSAFITAASVTYTANILNLNAVRTGSSSDIFDGCVLSFGTSNILDVNLTGSKFTNNGSGVGIGINANCTGQINNGFARSKSTYGGYFCGSSVDIMAFNNCIGIGYTGGTGIRLHNGGTANNCVGISDTGNGFFAAGNANNCVGISTSGTGFYNNGTANNCSGKSISGVGFEAQSSGLNSLNCVGISVSNVGIFASFALINCSGISSSSQGISFVATSTSAAYNCYAKSVSNFVFYGRNLSKIYGCTIVCEWNNAGGYGIRGAGGFIAADIVNTAILLANATAPYLFNDGTAAAILMRGNTYKGGAAFNVNLTNSTIAVEDAQGNIYL